MSADYKFELFFLKIFVMNKFKFFFIVYIDYTIILYLIFFFYIKILKLKIKKNYFFAYQKGVYLICGVVLHQDLKRSIQDHDRIGGIDQ